MTTSPAAAPLPLLRTVVVDDTQDLRELLRLALPAGGLEVVGEAGDGRTGIDVVRRARPDVVLLDLAMPVMDGLEALPAMRRAYPPATIVVLSAFDATRMAERAMSRGADGYVTKGGALDALFAHVRLLWSRRSGAAVTDRSDAS